MNSLFAQTTGTSVPVRDMQMTKSSATITGYDVRSAAGVLVWTGYAEKDPAGTITKIVLMRVSDGRRWTIEGPEAWHADDLALVGELMEAVKLQVTTAAVPMPQRPAIPIGPGSFILSEQPTALASPTP
ncbi:MAG: hypothetical protein IT442_04980 [Phycisphaeraceae bacterium]|nr:hypothetical protein [Phycisphaeraceae bacterium]